MKIVFIFGLIFVLLILDGCRSSQLFEKRILSEPELSAFAQDLVSSFETKDAIQNELVRNGFWIDKEWHTDGIRAVKSVKDSEFTGFSYQVILKQSSEGSFEIQKVTCSGFGP